MLAAIIRMVIIGDGFSEQISVPVGGKGHQPQLLPKCEVHSFPLCKKTKTHSTWAPALPDYHWNVKMVSLSFSFQGFFQLTLLTEL